MGVDRSRVLWDYSSMRKENTHMDHFEDRIVLSNSNPLSWINDILNDKVSVSRKWDGAPSIFVGRDESGIYVAKKGIFNKTPKLYHTSEQIEASLDGDLASKFIEVLETMRDSNLQVGDLIQGDLLFTRGDIQQTDNNYTFQANTIVYSTAIDLTKYWVGIVWHTKYVDGTAVYGHDIVNMIGDVWGLWQFNATDDIDPIDKNARALLEYMKKDYNSKKQSFTLNPFTIDLWCVYINYAIKKGLFNHESNVNGFADFVIGHMQRACDKVKREETKQKRIQEYAPVFQDLPKMAIVGELHGLLYQMKMVILESLNSCSSIDTYLRTSTGLIPTGHEGYVVINKSGVDAVKIVDREEFSRANFSEDVLKGWDK